MSDAEEEQKPSTDGGGDGDGGPQPITVRVKDQTGEETFFKIKDTTKMSKVFQTYATRKGVQPGSLRFLLDGERIEPHQTPKMLELEDNDQIDCVLEQTGGDGTDNEGGGGDGGDGGDGEGGGEQNAGGGSQPITVRVKDQTGEETFFKIKNTTKMSKVFQTYAQRKGVQPGSLRFLLDGERIEPDQTPKMLELEDNDQIDCVLEQTGGSGFAYLE